MYSRPSSTFLAKRFLPLGQAHAGKARMSLAPRRPQDARPKAAQVLGRTPV